MLKKFLMKKMMASQLKGMPKDQQEQILAMVEKNPELFMKISDEVKAEVKKGKTQMSATMSVMRKYQSELQKLSGQ